MKANERQHDDKPPKDISILELEMLVCMNELEKQELNDKNVEEFFDKIDNLLGQMNDLNDK